MPRDGGACQGRYPSAAARRTSQCPATNFGQRVWKRHAGGGLLGDGTSPESIWRWRPRASRGSATGTALNSAPVYGWRGLRVELVGVGELDDLAEVHHRDAIAHVAHDREVVRDEDQRQIELALQRPQQVEDLRLDRDVERETGSSATISFGFSAIARATPTRWRWPPENSCG